VNGIALCSVAFISQNPRPANGRITVLAYAEGLKQFIDVNGNNAYDVGIDGLLDLGDAYRDDNENGQYDLGEFVIPKGGTQVCAGSGGASPSRADTCTGAATLAATVRQELVLMIPSSAAAFTVVSPADTTDITFVTVRLNSAAHPLLPMPAGTVVSADALSSACKIGKISPSVVPNTSPGTPTSQLGSLHSIGLTGCGGSTIVITATSPSGVISTFSYLLPDSVPPPIVCTPPQVLQNGICVSPDTTPPVFTSAPAVDSITATSVRLSAMINEAGTGYYMYQLASLPAPSIAVLISGSSTPMAANTPVFVPIGGLTTGTQYKIYFIAKDASGIQQATMVTVPFTTL